MATSKGQGGKDITAGKLEGVPLDCRFSGSLDNPKRNCDATKLITALGLKMIKGITNIPGDVSDKILPGDKNPLGNLLNKLPGAKPDTQTDQQTGTQSTDSTQKNQTDDTVNQAKDLLKGILGQ